MKKKETCMDFGTFSISEKCDKCPRNLECLKETQSTEMCFSAAHLDDHGDLVCSFSCSDYEWKKRCMIYHFIDEKRDKVCENFGHPTVCKECLLCKHFADCESSEICIGNLGISVSEAKEIIEDQKESFRNPTDEDECFGKFSFEECWEGECEFKIECLRKVGILPDGSCIYFPSSAEGDLSKVCSNCIFEKDCISLWENEREKIKNENRMKQVFSSNLSIGKLRELLVEE